MRVRNYDVHHCLLAEKALKIMWEVPAPVPPDYTEWGRIGGISGLIDVWQRMLSGDLPPER